MIKDPDVVVSNASKYGQYYWCVKVPKSLAKEGEIYVHADKVIVKDCGSLCFISENEKQGHIYNMALSAGNWLCFFAASCLDGNACAVEHWKGEKISD